MPQGMGGSTRRWASSCVEVSAERVVAHDARVEGNTQPYGLLHGGASVVLAETLGSIGSALHAWPDRLAGRRRHQRHPPPRRHRPGTVTGRRDRGAPRPHAWRRYEVVISDEQRPAGVHLADHLRPDAGRAGRRTSAD